MDLDCGFDELKAFYSDFTNVSIEGESIIIEQGNRIKLTIHDKKITITVE